jgi:hypothetical protein
MATCFLDSISPKYLYGSEQFIPFCGLWDTEHWNQHHPRLDEYDPIAHEQYYNENRSWYRYLSPSTETLCSNANSSFSTVNPLRPYASGDRTLTVYARYAAERKGPYIQEGGRRDPAKLIMFQGALRPSLYLRQLIAHHAHQWTGRTTRSSDNETIDYMKLHARVKPDMQRHPVCGDKKVLNLTDIFDFMESCWKDRPASHVVMPINRRLLEKEVKRENKETDSIANEHLKALDRARDKGLWGGWGGWGGRAGQGV